MTESPDRKQPAQGAPAPLALAAALAAVEALVLIVEGLSLLPAMNGERLAMGVTSLVFFLVYGGGLAYFAWRLFRLSSWARAPIVLAQLIQIMVGASFWGGATTMVSVVVVTVGLLTLVAIFHPASIAALESAD